MIKITTIKINVLQLKLIVIFLLFIVISICLKSEIVGKSIINKVSTDVFKQAIKQTIVIEDNNVVKKPILENFISTNEILKYIVGFNIKKPETVLAYQIPFIQDAIELNKLEIPESKFDVDENNNIVVPEKENENQQKNETEKKQEQENQDKVVQPIEKVVKGKGIVLKNETNYAIDLNNIISQPLKIKQDKKPQILIYHTHTEESFTPSKQFKFDHSDTDRTSDLRYTVVRVGDEISNILEKQYNIKVIHDTTIHDGSSYNSAYVKSQKTVEAYIKKYPNLSMIIDLHRDAADFNGKKLRVSTNIDGKSAAQVMTVLGTDGRGLPHKFWRDNLNLGVKFAKKMNDLYPGLSRGIDLKLGRFNQFLSKNAMLIEVGSNGNTVDETLESSKYIARTIAEVLKEAK